MNSDLLMAGIDVGTTNIKAVIFDPTGKTIAQAHTPTPVQYPRPTWAYYDPTQLWQSTADVLRQAVQQLDDPNRIASIAVASMGEAGVPLDSAGQPTYDAIAWFDQRTQSQSEWLANKIGKERLFKISGLSLQPIFGLCKLLWLKQNQPDAFARTVRWLNVADFIAYRLCGVPATDYSLASRTLALNLEKLHWHESLIKEVGLPPQLFAPLCASGTQLGTVTPEAARLTGLPTSASVSAGGHDHVCGALAVGVAEPGVMLNSMGTAEAIFLPLERPIQDPTLGFRGYTQGAHVIAGHFYVLAGLYTSGACVDWLRDITGQTEDFTSLLAAAAQVPLGSLGVGFLPHLRLANPPHDDPLGRGSFVGLSTDAKQEVLFRALLEGLAYEARYSLEGLLAFPGIEPIRDIFLVGGSTRNRLLMQIKATVLNQPLTVVEVTEATSLGAAVLGALGAGVYANLTELRNTISYEQVLVEPIADHVLTYETYYEQVYRHIYTALRDLHHTTYQLLHQQTELGNKP